MYAIFEAKGKQWRAEHGATLKLPSLDAEPGDRVTFDRVLLARRGEDDVLVGRPTLRNASVSVEVVEHGREDKIIVFKRKRRKNYRRKYGHRQPYTEVRIVEVDLEDATAPAPAEREPEAAPEPAPEPTDAEAGEAGEEAPAVAEAEPEPEDAEEIDITSAAEELAGEHDLDLTGIEGTGKDGRILKSDVQEAIRELEEEEAAEAGDEAAEADVADEAAAADEAGAVIPDEVDITGAARELAEEHGLDVTGIEGTGKEGRILKSDVQDAIESQQED
jgi:large subunit ribosomal protein L21